MEAVPVFSVAPERAWSATEWCLASLFKPPSNIYPECLFRLRWTSIREGIAKTLQRWQRVGSWAKSKHDSCFSKMSHICIWVLENQHRLWRNILGQDWKFFDVSGTPTPHPLLILRNLPWCLENTQGCPTGPGLRIFLESTFRQWQWGAGIGEGWQLHPYISVGAACSLRFTSVMDLMAVSGGGQSKEYEVHLMIPVGQMLSQQVKKDGHAIMHLTSISDKIFYAQAVYVPFDGVCVADAEASFQEEMHAAHAWSAMAIRMRSSSFLLRTQNGFGRQTLWAAQLAVCRMSCGWEEGISELHTEFKTHDITNTKSAGW